MNNRSEQHTGESVLVEKLRRGRDVSSRLEAAAKLEEDAEVIKRLSYALGRCQTMAENAAYRIGRPGHAPSLADIQTGFNDIALEAQEARTALSKAKSAEAA